MSHILVITDVNGKILAKVKVEPGYKVKEVREVETKKSTTPATERAAGDGGLGTEKIE